MQEGQNSASVPRIVSSQHVDDVGEEDETHDGEKHQQQDVHHGGRAGGWREKMREHAAATPEKESEKIGTLRVGLGEKDHAHFLDKEKR